MLHIQLQQDAIEVKIDALEACEPTPLTSADVSAGAITLSTAGNYCLAGDITANITISTANVMLNLNKRELTGTITISSTFTSNIIIRNGFIKAPVVLVSSPPAAISVSGPLGGEAPLVIEDVSIFCDLTGMDGEGRSGIFVPAQNPAFCNVCFVLIRNCCIEVGNSDDSTSEPIGKTGGHGILLIGAKDVVIDSCIIESGFGQIASSSSSTGGDGGNGISVEADSSHVVITNCTITTGKGGNATNTSSTGGNGGNGISVEQNPSQVAITDCLILETGVGGDGIGGGSGGGNGGHGVFIGSGASDIFVRRCTIQNTGAGGAGAPPGDGGKAIDDDVAVPPNYSQIFSNFAHNIDNATKFDLQAAGEAGILTPNPPTGPMVNPFANVYSS